MAHKLTPYQKEWKRSTPEMVSTPEFVDRSGLSADVLYKWARLPPVKRPIPLLTPAQTGANVFLLPREPFERWLKGETQTA